MKVYSFVNEKGGVGKSTSCLNVGAGLAREGKSVLLVDLDPQGSLSKIAGFRDVESMEETVAEAIREGDGLVWSIQKHGEKFPYDVAVADLRLATVNLDLASDPNRNKKLSQAIRALRTPYDYVLIDCSPSLSVLTIMGMAASDEVIVPVNPQVMPLDGIKDLLKIMELSSKMVGRKIKIGGVLITMVNSRRALDKEVIEAIRKRFPTETYQAVVKNLSKVAEAPSVGLDLFEYDPRGEATEAYHQIALEILRRDQEKIRRSK